MAGVLRLRKQASERARGEQPREEGKEAGGRREGGRRERETPAATEKKEIN